MPVEGFVQFISRIKHPAASYGVLGRWFFVGRASTRRGWRIEVKHWVETRPKKTQRRKRRGIEAQEIQVYSFLKKAYFRLS